MQYAAVILLHSLIEVGAGVTVEQYQTHAVKNISNHSYWSENLLVSCWCLQCLLLLLYAMQCAAVILLHSPVEVGAAVTVETR